MVSDIDRPSRPHLKRFDLGPVPDDQIGTGAAHLDAGPNRLRLTLSEWFPVITWLPIEAADGTWWVIGSDLADNVVGVVRMTPSRCRSRCAAEVAAALNRVYGTPSA